MTNSEQRKAAKEFADYWKDKGYEKGESQPFWLSLLSNVLGIKNPEQYIKFENKVKIDHTSFIDGIIQKTHVLIEQKSANKDLKKGIKQSDGTFLTPFQQAKRYSTELPYSERPRWIVTCNFHNFLIYDMENPTSEPQELLLSDLPNEYYRLNFLVDEENIDIKKEMEVSIQAGNLVGILYDELLKQYKDPENAESLKSLNILCVRLVFCLYAEDACIFGQHNMFHDYLKKFSVNDTRRALIDLFKVLDTKQEDRDPYIDERLAIFPYVNGGLFADENIEIPTINEKIYNILLYNASENFDWKNISPTIFGAVFESTLNPETRRIGGMHYTSIENIHKVIDPLFLNDIRKEFNEIKAEKKKKTKEKRLMEFQKKISNLKFLDPACGSGNFLTETYISLRRIENEVISLRIRLQEKIEDGQIMFGYSDNEDYDPIKVSIGQFYGIEINDFAVTVAKTALWIAESQMMKETENIINKNLEFLPLKSYTNIFEANSLRIDWNQIIDKSKLNYIIGNPPFNGARLMSHEQKEDMSSIFGKLKGIGNLDYVCAWYKKASDFMKGTSIRAALFSTNSITQGVQVPILWKPLMDEGIRINFAYRTFKWNSEAKEKAAVHCVIIGFSFIESNYNDLFYNEKSMNKVKNINGYLIDAPNIFISERKEPICNVPKMVIGSMPNDGGKLSNYTDEEVKNIIKKYPVAKEMFYKFVGAKEFLNNKYRWCLWLKDISPSKIKSIAPIKKAVEEVYNLRINSPRKETKKLAEIPYLFGEIRQPSTDYLIVPRHSSEYRRYIPIGYMKSNIICGDANLIIPDATLFHFGVLISNVHMAWMRAIAGRIKSDYRYSATIVYNNFPWCNPNKEDLRNIELTAQAILDARKKYKNEPLDSLYDDNLMPPELRNAHRANDFAVMKAYGFSKDMTQSRCVAELMKKYQNKLVNRI